MENFQQHSLPIFDVQLNLKQTKTPVFMQPKRNGHGLYLSHFHCSEMQRTPTLSYSARPAEGKNFPLLQLEWCVAPVFKTCMWVGILVLSVCVETKVPKD